MDREKKVPLEEIGATLEESERDESKKEIRSKIVETASELLPDKGYKILMNLRGDNSNEAWELRDTAYSINPSMQLDVQLSRDWKDGYLVDEHLEPLWAFSKALTGQTSKESYNVRRKLLKIEEDLPKNLRGDLISGVIASLEEQDSKEAWKMRDECEKLADILGIKEQNKNFAWQKLRGVKGIDTKKSWKLRKKIIEGLEDNDLEFYNISKSMSESIKELESEESWKMRRKILREGDALDASESLEGIDSVDAWRIRGKIIERLNKFDDSVHGERQRNILFNSLVTGLKGIESNKAWKLRRKYKEYYDNLDLEKAKINPQLVASVLAESVQGLDSEESWTMREEFSEIYPTVAAKSLKGLDSKHAWQMRGNLTERCKNNPSAITNLLG